MSVTPAARNSSIGEMRKGWPRIGTTALGRRQVRGRSRSALPPARMTAFIPRSARYRPEAARGSGERRSSGSAQGPDRDEAVPPVDQDADRIGSGDDQISWDQPVEHPLDEGFEVVRPERHAHDAPPLDGRAVEAAPDQPDGVGGDPGSASDPEHIHLTVALVAEEQPPLSAEPGQRVGGEEDLGQLVQKPPSVRFRR